MTRHPVGREWLAPVLVCWLTITAVAGERVERFDTDPKWEGRNNRAEQPRPRTIRQDFGYDPAAKAVGGLVTPAAEPAFYAKRIDKKTFDDPLTASGRLTCKGRNFHALVAFFNAGTLNEWRTPNTVAVRLLGRRGVFYAYVEYCTARWRAGGDDPGGFATVRDPKTGRAEPRGFRTGVAHDFTLRYDPKGNAGGGVVTLTIDDETSVCHLAKGHKADGAAFNRFGLLPVLKSADTGGEVWLDNVVIDGRAEDFTRDPGWEGRGNRRVYETANVRPRFDFGYSPTRFAGGSAGELGGRVFRGDCRSADKLAAYGDRLGPLSLAKPLRASGKVSLRRGVSDSTTLLGFYHSADSLRVNPSQASGWPECFLGVAVEGPSREGFQFYPAYRGKGGAQGSASGPNLPHILPDGKPHDWSLAYDPAAAGGRGRVVVTFDGKPVALDLGTGHTTGARFDRFGLVTTWIDGNAQHVYFDDLTYTCGQ
ncbi:MAG TPA: hypothetical protein VFG68_23220 [Fimbriiglobus sp.]|nr:hypothetical protein [Fimbriiglobus sp.]